MKSVSVVIPAYRAESSILTAVESALAQGARVREVIVVIDGLFDNTKGVLEICKDSRLKIIAFSENKGAQVARNKGLKVSSGDYVVFLDSDDFFEGPVIDEAAKVLDQGEADFCLSPNGLISVEGNKTYFQVSSTITHFDLLIGRLLSTMAVGIQCILWRRTFLEDIGGWDETVARNQDGELAIRSLIKGGVPGYNQEGAGCSVHHDGERISSKRTLGSFTTQSKIYENVSDFIERGGLKIPERIRLKAALNYFCINLCMGMAESGHLGKEYLEWKDRIDWRLKHFFVLPKNKSFVAFIFFIFGKKSCHAKKVFKKFFNSLRHGTDS